MLISSRHFSGGAFFATALRRLLSLLFFIRSSYIWFISYAHYIISTKCFTTWGYVRVRVRVRIKRVFSRIKKSNFISQNWVQHYWATIMCWFQCAVFYVTTAYCRRENTLRDLNSGSSLSSSLPKILWVGPVGTSTQTLRPEGLVHKVPVIALTYTWNGGSHLLQVTSACLPSPLPSRFEILKWP